MNAKKAKSLRRQIRNSNAFEPGIDRLEYQRLKTEATAHPTTMSRVSSTMPGIPVAKQASGFKGFRKNQPSYGPEIAKWGVNRDRTRKVRMPNMQLPFGLSPLMLNLFRSVGLISG